MKKTDTIVTAYAERASGPGWANAPLWVIVRGLDGSLRSECLQPDEYGPEIAALYAVSEAAHLSMRGAVCRKVKMKHKAA